MRGRGRATAVSLAADWRDAPSSAGHRELLLGMFHAAVESASAGRCIPRHLPSPPKGRTIVVGAGKAAAAMARAVEEHWPGAIEGVVVVPYGHAVPCRQVRVLEASHPLPDEAGLRAARAILDASGGLTADDLVLCLFSGGGSALLPAPPAGVSLAEEQALAQALLRSGATIAEMNCVRKHVSLIKGGRLALAARPAAIRTLVISDVPGDDPATVASGPTIADPSTRHDASTILAKYGIDAGPAISAWLNSDASETPDAAEIPEADCRVIASARGALEAAAAVARRSGYTPLILGDAMEGEASVVGLSQARLVHELLASGRPVSPPCVLLSGGETSVTVRGDGRGGRNVEFLLALATGIAGASGVCAIAADTDGIDGTEDNAGAIVDETSLARAATLGIDPAAHLRRNDAYTFFATTGDLVTTGPTLTNVNDFRAILIDAPRTPELDRE